MLQPAPTCIACGRRTSRLATGGRSALRPLQRALEPNDKRGGPPTDWPRLWGYRRPPTPSPSPKRPPSARKRRDAPQNRASRPTAGTRGQVQGSQHRQGHTPTTHTHTHTLGSQGRACARSRRTHRGGSSALRRPSRAMPSMHRRRTSIDLRQPPHESQLGEDQHPSASAQQSRARSEGAAAAQPSRRERPANAPLRASVARPAMCESVLQPLGRSDPAACGPRGRCSSATARSSCKEGSSSMCYHRHRRGRPTSATTLRSRRHQIHVLELEVRVPRRQSALHETATVVTERSRVDCLEAGDAQGMQHASSSRASRFRCAFQVSPAALSDHASVVLVACIQRWGVQRGLRRYTDEECVG